MLRTLKSQVLRATRATGLNRKLSETEWRRNQLLILCYHGISQDDEHEWNPGLFMRPQVFERRLEILKQGTYRVLSLSEGLDRLAKGSLPPRSVVLTFDDGMVNFRSHALPILRKFGYPATVYLRTDYCDYRRPVFPPVCPYMLWKKRDSIVASNSELGWLQAQDLRTREGRSRALFDIHRIDEERGLSADERDAIVAELARHVGIDYSAFLESYILQIMSPEDIRGIAQEGIDVQLHTHSHQLIPTLMRGEGLETEIGENRRRIFQLTGCNPVHFCYPSGKYNLESLPALRQLGIVTATTCDPDLVDRSSNPLLLPRYVDTDVRPEAEFEAWLSGVGSLLVRLGLSRNRYGSAASMPEEPCI
jgi:peptidoglycan/xylan/chitin deacetylase (PgdA/CDA1 family)